MKKIITLIAAMVAVSLTSFAQIHVGSSTSSTNYLGDRITVHRDAYGRTTGTSISSTDYLIIAH